MPTFACQRRHRRTFAFEGEKNQFCFNCSFEVPVSFRGLKDLQKPVETGYIKVSDIVVNSTKKV